VKPIVFVVVVFVNVGPNTSDLLPHVVVALWAHMRNVDRADRPIGLVRSDNESIAFRPKVASPAEKALDKTRGRDISRQRHETGTYPQVSRIRRMLAWPLSVEYTAHKIVCRFSPDVSAS
jgi:hypothetical protein